MDRRLSLLLATLPTRATSRVIGFLAGLPVPVPLRPILLGTFARWTGLDLDEVELPLTGYPSLQALFTRRLRPRARPAPEALDVLASPVDARVLSAGPIPGADGLAVKGARFTPSELLGPGASGEDWAGGSQVTLYLCPADYHRVHAPCPGVVSRWNLHPGRLLPVNPPTLRARARVFPGNFRISSCWEEPEKGRRLWMVLVGALNVGSILVDWDRSLALASRRKPAPGPDAHPLRRYRTGQEVGCFRLGSTVVLLLPSGQAELAALEPGRRVRAGETLGRLLPAAPRHGILRGDGTWPLRLPS